MPLYEYRCDACGQRFELIQRFSDAPPESCRLCGKGPVERLLSSPAFQFKGSGWYVTDYAKKGGSSGSSADSSGSSASSTSESKPAEPAKPDAPAKADTAS